MTESKNIISCHPYLGMTEEEARTARARAWLYIFNCYEKHKAARTDGGKDAKGESEHEFRTTPTNVARGPPKIT